MKSNGTETVVHFCPQELDSTEKTGIREHSLEFVHRIEGRGLSVEKNPPECIAKWVTWGAGPRASMNLILSAKARAILRGESHVAWEDIRAVAKPVLRHRIILNFAAQAEKMATDDIVDQLLAYVGDGR